MAQVVRIGGKEYAYSYDYGAILYYEKLSGRFEDTGKMLESVAVHYSCLVSGSNGEFTMSLAEFVSKLDTKEVIEQLNDALRIEYARWSGNQADLPALDNTDSDNKKTARKKK